MPENDLADLTDADLRILDWALYALKDQHAKGKFDLGLTRTRRWSTCTTWC